MSRTVVMLAAENGALAGGKVGGIGDVVRDLPLAVAAAGWRVIVITPAYGPVDADEVDTVTTRFGGSSISARFLKPTALTSSLTHLVIEHPLLQGVVPGQIYTDDGPHRPFASDATRFTLFSCLAAAWICEQQREQQLSVDVIHLHDWHAAPLLLLREFDSSFRALQDIHCVYTIHNLALQGIRPLRGDASSLFEWLPDLIVDSRVIDPRWSDCINMMRVGINLADQVNTVSPSYALEVQHSDDPVTGFHGGQGLEADLRTCAKQDRLVGILNGCDYDGVTRKQPLALSTLLKSAKQVVLRHAAKEKYVRSTHLTSLERIASMGRRRDQILVTSVGRLTAQKVALLQHPVDGAPLLHHMLQTLGKQGVMIMLGTGDEDIESFLNACSALFDNFLLVNAFDESFSEDLYRSGQLFLMPSVFEPCGISQMLAMRRGQPCLVHQVGGLRDTVKDGVNGWSFSGGSIDQQAGGALSCFQEACRVISNEADRYSAICRSATAARFTWESAAKEYMQRLYVRDSTAVPASANDKAAQADG